jgi:hypothetical protein
MLRALKLPAKRFFGRIWPRYPQGNSRACLVNQRLGTKSGRFVHRYTRATPGRLDFLRISFFVATEGSPYVTVLNFPQKGSRSNCSGTEPLLGRGRSTIGELI